MSDTTMREAILTALPKEMISKYQEVFDCLRKLNNITELSFDIYQPQAYMYHSRLTYRVPIKETYVPQVEDFKLDPKLYVVGLNSQVNQYENNHIILIDFDGTELKMMEQWLWDYGLHGWLFMSGKSYHFVGNEVMSQDRWRLLMEELAKKKPEFICSEFIKWSLLRNYGTLRFTKNPIKPKAPVFVKEV